MLVLSRRVDEEVVVIDPDTNQPVIRFRVISVRGNTIRLGIVAPRDVPVHRLEVYEAITGKAG